MNNQSRHQRMVIDLSLQILRQAMAAADKEKVNTISVRLALRCLLPHCPERWPLFTFWDGAGSPFDLGRSASCTAAFNGIVRQLRAAGRYPE